MDSPFCDYELQELKCSCNQNGTIVCCIMKKKRLYLNPEELASAFILLLTEEPPLQPDGTVQLVLDLQVSQDHKHFGGAALPVKLMGA